MHQYKKILLVAGFFLTCLNISFGQKPTPMLNIQYWKTSTDIPVYFVEAKNPPELLVAVSFAAGSVNEGARWGLSFATNKIIQDGGTQRLSSQEVANEKSDYGCVISGDADKEASTLTLLTLSDQPYQNHCIALYHDTLINPKLSSDTLNQVKQEMLAEQQAQEESPEAQADLAFMEALYQKNPLAHNMLGTPKTVTLLTRGDIIKFYDTYYVRNNAAIFIVGNIEKATAIKLSNQLTKGLPQGQKAPLPDKMKPTESKQHFIVESNQTYIRIGTLFPFKSSTQDRFAQLVGNYILGGGVLVSKLNHVIREQNGLSYNIGSQFLSLKPQKPWLIQLQTKNSDTSKALALTMNTLGEYLAAGPSKKEIDQTKVALINRLPLSISDNSKIMSMLGIIYFNELPIDFLDTYSQNIQAVTYQQILDSFQKHIAPSKLTTVIVGGKP